MDVDALMDAYVQDVVKLLPRKLRADVALELRDLVREELRSRASAQGHVLDQGIALEGLRAFGKPQDVAARYFEPWVIIPNTQTRRFVFAAIVGTLVLIALSPLNHEPSLPQQLGLAILAWLGVLVAYFGIRAAIQHSGKAERPWVPRGSDDVNRGGSIALIVLIIVGIVAYGAPGWLFSKLTDGLTLAASLDYDPAFHSSRLPVLFFLWGCQAVMFAVLAIRGRWNPLLRQVDLCLEAAVVLVLFWFLVAGNLFKEAVTNKAAWSLISAFILIMLIDLGVKLYRGDTRTLATD